MKKTFIETLTNLAKIDKDIYLLTGDLGFSVFEDFASKFPDRFIDCGVAEQNMTGIAAGLALSGKKPYIYSIAPFVTMRCFEQIRNDICYQGLNVKIIGVGAGFSYGPLGSTHHATEDISIFRSLPNIMILSPADSVEAKELILQSYKISGPVYIRLDKSEKFLLNKNSKIKLAKPNIIVKGDAGTIMITGAYLQEAINIVNKLKRKNINLTLVSLHTLKPVDEKAVMKEFTGKHLFVIEEHKEVGGLTSVVSEILSKNNINIIFKSFALPINYRDITGRQLFLRQKNKIDENNIYRKILKLYGK